MSENSTSDLGCGCLFGLILLCTVGFVYWSYQSDHSFAAAHVIALVCRDGLDDAKNCVRVLSIGDEIELIATENTNQVHVNIIVGRRHKVGSFFLSNCQVANRENWICKTPQPGGAEETGMINGKYYVSDIIIGYAYYCSSVYGWNYWLYKLGLYVPKFEGTNR